MALVCDICSRKIRAGTGYALTTKQVVTDPAYWEYVFQHGVLVDEMLADLVSNQAGSRTPWLVCGKCIEIFEVDRMRARELSEKFWSAPNATRTGWRQDTGDAPFDKSLEAAVEAWIKVFHTSPIPTLIKQFVTEKIGQGYGVYIKKEFLQKLEQKFKKGSK